jgi:hypothetical protein
VLPPQITTPALARGRDCGRSSATSRSTGAVPCRANPCSWAATARVDPCRDRRKRSFESGRWDSSGTPVAPFQNENPRFTGVLEADEGTRTLDLLHGKYAGAVPESAKRPPLSQSGFPSVPAEAHRFRQFTDPLLTRGGAWPWCRLRGGELPSWGHNGMVGSCPTTTRGGCVSRTPHAHPLLDTTWFLARKRNGRSQERSPASKSSKAHGDATRSIRPLWTKVVAVAPTACSSVFVSRSPITGFTGGGDKGRPAGVSSLEGASFHPWAAPTRSSGRA